MQKKKIIIHLDGAVVIMYVEMKDVSCSLDHDRPDKINMYRLKSMKICMTITCCLVRW